MEYVACCKYPEDAAALVALMGEGAKVKYGHNLVVWIEGAESHSAAESYDLTAATMQQRKYAAFQESYDKVHGTKPATPRRQQMETKHATELAKAIDRLAAFDDLSHPQHVAVIEFFVDEAARTEQEYSRERAREILRDDVYYALDDFEAAHANLSQAVVNFAQQRGDLLAQLRKTNEAIKEACRLSALHAGYEYGFKSIVEANDALLAQALGQ